MTGPIGIESHVGPPIGVAGDTQRYSLRLYGDGTGTAAPPVTVRPLSMSGWFKRVESGGSGQVLFGIDNTNSSSTSILLRVFDFSGGRRLQFLPRTTAVVADSSNQWHVNQWHFAALTFAADGDYALWLDDQKVTGNTESAATGIDTAVIGHRRNFGDPATFFTGKLRNIYMFDQVLSDSQVGELRSEQSPTGVTPVAHWPLSDGSGSEAEELIAGNNAALVNHAWSTDAPDILDL